MKYLSVYNEVNKQEKTDFVKSKTKICELCFLCCDFLKRVTE